MRRERERTSQSGARPVCLRALRPLSWLVVLLLALRRPAGRTCTISRSTSRCGESTFFADERSARPLVAGTVARGQLRDDALLYTGKVNGADATVFPFPIDER